MSLYYTYNYLNNVGLIFRVLSLIYVRIIKCQTLIICGTKLALFGWAVVITAVLLLLSLPVLAGKFIEIVPALNLANCWELWYIIQSAGNLLSSDLKGIFRDYTLEFICCIGLMAILRRRRHHPWGMGASKFKKSFT